MAKKLAEDKVAKGLRNDSNEPCRETTGFLKGDPIRFRQRDSEPGEASRLEVEARTP
jgi:hypothetical protein